MSREPSAITFADEECLASADPSDHRSRPPSDTEARLAAYGEIFAFFRPFLLRVAYRRIPRHLTTKETPSDIVQETFLVICRSLINLERRTPIQQVQLLNKVLRCRVANLIRKYRVDGKRSPAREVAVERLVESGRCADDAFRSPAAQPSEIAQTQETAGRLREAIDELPDIEAKVLRMRMLEFQDFATIGRILKMPENTVGKIAKRGIERLKIRLAVLDPNRD